MLLYQQERTGGVWAFKGATDPSTKLTNGRFFEDFRGQSRLFALTSIGGLLELTLPPRRNAMGTLCMKPFQHNVWNPLCPIYRSLVPGNSRCLLHEPATKVLRKGLRGNGHHLRQQAKHSLPDAARHLLRLRCRREASCTGYCHREARVYLSRNIQRKSRAPFWILPEP